MSRTIFDDRIATALLANQNSDVVGPGRLSRCREVQFVAKFAADCNAGLVAVKEYADQDCAGTGELKGNLNAAAGAVVSLNLTGSFGFLRAEASGAINGAGVSSIQARGN